MYKRQCCVNTATLAVISYRRCANIEPTSTSRVNLWRADAPDFGAHPTEMSLNPYNAEILLHKPWRPNGFFQYAINLNVLVSSFRFI